jgi:4-amino-4-deoxy-L-arabinose transferase-like glycosyltransferase
LANIAFGGASFVGVYHLTKRLTQDEVIARTALLALTVYPNHIAYANLLLTEVMYTSFLLWAFILATDRPVLWYWSASGFLFGLAALTKAQTLVFPIFMFYLLFLIEGRSIDRVKAMTWLRENVLRIAIVNLIMFAVVAPWTWRNYQLFDAFIPISTNGGITLLVGNNPNATGDYLSLDLLPAGYITVLHDERVARQVERDQQAGRSALRWIRENPIAFLMLVPRKLFRLWGPDGEGEWGFQAGYADYEPYRLLFRVVRYANQAFYIMILGFAMFATMTVVARRTFPLKLLECLIVPLFTTLLSIIFIGQPRFHFSSMPYLFILAAAGLSQLGPSRGGTAFRA